MRERKLTRLNGYDYTQDGYYFVTACTKDRIHWFGEIRDSKMVLNQWGTIVAEQWEWLREHYRYVVIDQYCVMPNHFHGILAIVGNGRDRSLHQKIKPLPELMGAFKTTSSKSIHNAGLSEFQWQKSYHDRVIRNETELNNVRQYILDNSLEWETDSENPSAIRNSFLPNPMSGKIRGMK